MASRIATLTAGALFGAAATYAVVNHTPAEADSAVVARPPAGSAVLPQAFSPFTAPAAFYGLPAPSSMLRTTSSYVSSFDFKTKNPQWVAEHLTKESIKGAASRENLVFREDPMIPEMFRARLSDYLRSGFDRGHLMPAADAKDSMEKMQDTFYLTNISPQVGQGFNRDYWARLEQFVRNLTNSYDNVYCVTGTAFLPKKEGDKYYVKYQVIGEPPNVAVPTHFFKVVLGVSKGKPPAIGAFLVPNAEIKESMPLESFSVPLEWIEKATGHVFFNLLPEKVQKKTVPALCSETKCILPPAWKPKGGKSNEE